jgi:hypothetical protein
MTFLSPWMLLGGAAVSIPIALHFFFKSRYRPLPWAAMKFLKEAIEQTSRRLKFQEWVLLALRCLVILLLALALARPGQRSAGSAGRGDAVDAVLVFDTSFSMGAQDGDKTRLDRAKEAALAVLDSLPQNSSVQIYACSDRATLLGPVSRYNLDQARQLVPTVELSGLSTDFLPGLTEALNAAASGTAPAKEIYLFTDLQKLGFDRQQGAIRAKCEEIRNRANLVFVRCGNPDRRVPNVAVTDVALIGDIPHTRTRVPFVITLKNTGTVPVKGVKVRLELDGKAVEEDAQQLDEIEPGQAVPVTLTGSLGEVAGPRVLGVEITGDGLPGDNKLARVVLVRDQVRVLVVDGTPNFEQPTESGSHFVRNALTPVAPSQTESYYIKPDVVTVSEASPATLAAKDLCYVLNAPVSTDERPTAGLTPEFVARLNEFVRGGGGLVIGSGDLIRPEDYNLVLGSKGAGLLPFDLAEAETTGEAYPFTAAPETVDHPSFLSPFREAPFNAALREVGLTKLFRLNEGGPGAAGGRVLVRTADLKPLIASRVVGEGEVVHVATSLDTRWGNFPARSEAFVPFTRFTLAHLTGRKVPGGNRTAGDPLVYAPPEAAKVFELVQPLRAGEPAARRVKLGQPQAITPGSRPTVTAADTALAGVYRIVAEGDPDTKGPIFAVNPDLRESANLDVASEDDLEKLLGFRPAVIQAGAGTEAAVSQQRIRREWTEWVLVVLLVLLVGESVWAWVCGKAW